MNNKGFGLSELLVFIGIFLFILVAVAIYGRVKLGDSIYYDESDVQTEEEKTDIEPTVIEIPKEYIALENKLKNASKKYSFIKTENVIITLEELQLASLIGDLKDPNDSTVSCDGYVIYDKNEKTLTPYINCNGMYVTENYDENILK